MSLSDDERRLLMLAGTSGDTTLRRQAVAIALAKTGDDQSTARDLLVGGFLEATQPSFHLIPRGDAMTSEAMFVDAYKRLADATDEFTSVNVGALAGLLFEHPQALVPLRMVIGFTTNELAVACGLVDPSSRITGNAIKAFERRSIPAQMSDSKRAERRRFVHLVASTVMAVMRREVLAVPDAASVMFHSKLDKSDTTSGWADVAESAKGVPYSTLLYQRYVGGVWRQVQDAYSEVKGDELAEMPVETLFAANGVPYWRTPRGAAGAQLTSQRYGLHPGPDFVLPDESPTVVLESKIGEDGGTVRDKAARIQAMCHAAAQRGLVPCAVVDGKGWAERPSALFDVIVATSGRTYTLTTLPALMQVPEIAALRSAPRDDA